MVLLLLLVVVIKKIVCATVDGDDKVIPCWQKNISFFSQMKKWLSNNSVIDSKPAGHHCYYQFPIMKTKERNAEQVPARTS